MLIAQISDCHITEPGDLMADRVDPTVGLRLAVEHLVGLGDAVDLVLATGDLVNDGGAGEYDVLEALLAPLPQRLVVVPGNHDDRTELRRRFGLPAGEPTEPIRQVVDLDEARIICLDTNVPGHHHGSVDDEQLAWLDQALASRVDVPALIVQHHPPFESGIDQMDRYRLAGAAREADVVGRHDHAVGVLAGHFHRPIVRGFAGTVAFACPSTAAQLLGRLGSGPTTYCDDPPALALHDLTDGSLTTHVVQLRDTTAWTPSWAT